MKHKMFAAIIVIMLCVLGIGLYQFSQAPSGNTVKGREEILRELSIGTHLKIAKEQNVENYLISGVYSDNQAGIAIFEQDNNANCKLISVECRGADDIVISQCLIQDQWYDLIWFNGASTNYAEVTYTIVGVKAAPIVFDTTDMNLICSKTPSNHYSIEVSYYDDDGNVYE